MQLKYALMMASATLALASCGEPMDQPREMYAAAPTRVCRDTNGVRLPDQRCEVRQSGSSAGVMPMWFYMNSGARVPEVGSRFTSSSVGSFKPSPSTSYVAAASKAPTTISRGGFGGRSSFSAGG